MGVFKALNNSVSSVMKDVWRDCFYCDAISDNVLVSKGKRKNDTSNNRGSENIISHGSTVIVNEGQSIIMVKDGAVVDICSKAGAYIYEYKDSGSDIPAQQLKAGLLGSLLDVGRRLSYAGEIVEDHRVYYVNTKDIIGVLFGSANPIPFRVVDNNIGLDMDISLRLNGAFSYKIVDPAIFYKTVCGNVVDTYSRSQLDGRLKDELMTAMHPVLGQMSAMGIRYNAITYHVQEMLDILNNTLNSKWRYSLGVELTSITFASIQADEDDEDTIKELQKVAVFRNSGMAAANLISSQAEAMKLAASNTSAGPIMALAGLNAFGNMNTQNQAMSILCGTQQESNKIQAPKSNSIWRCNCGAEVQGNFCSNCGSKRPANRCCSRCGTVHSEAMPIKYCCNCGTLL